LTASPHRLAPAASLAAVLGLVATAGACGGSKPPTLPTRDTIPDSADQVMCGLRHFRWNGGIRRAQLLSDTAFFYDQMNRIELHKVKVIFYTAAGDSNAVMTGLRGTYDVRQQRLDGRGDVKLTSVDGKRLSSPHLVYDRVVNQVTSDTSFTFSEPGRTVTGIGLRTDPQLRNVQVLKAAGGRAVLGPAGARR
jgi:LPS export ABC transporter protein LptC